jgi:hypothetical protein
MISLGVSHLPFFSSFDINHEFYIHIKHDRCRFSVTVITLCEKPAQTSARGGFNKIQQVY